MTDTPQSNESHTPKLDTHSLDEKLHKALKREGLLKTASSDESASLSGLGFGMRIATEFLVGTLVGMAMGFGLDKLCGTAPLFILIFTLLGFGAGMLNVYRFIMKMDDSIGLNRSGYLTEREQSGRQNTGENPSEHNS
jgi:ATP synthase protein I